MRTSPTAVEPLVLDETDAPLAGWDEPVKGRIRWRTLFSKGGTPTDGITCGVADLEPGDWLGLHRHKPPEIYFVLAGTGVMTLDGREIAVKAGSAVASQGAIQTDAITRYGAVIFVGCCHWRRRSWVGRGLSNRRSSRR